MELSVVLSKRGGRQDALARDTCRKECVKQVPSQGTAQSVTFLTGEDHISQVKLRQSKCQLASNWYYSWVQEIMASGWQGAERSMVRALPKGLDIFHSTLIYPQKHLLLGSTVFQALKRMGGTTLTVQGWAAHTGIQVSDSPAPTPATRRSGRVCRKNKIG